MKKPLLFFIALFLWTGSSWGQTAIIGTGTSTTNGTSADPIERYYKYEHFQIVYTAAELTTAGMPSGALINSMGFSVSESAVSLANFTIDMGLTTQTIANPYISTGLTTVKNSFTYAPVVQVAGSFDMITFDANFTWDGTSSIVVNTCTGLNSFASPYGGLRYTTATSGSMRYNRTDGSSNCATATTLNSSNKPNIRFDYTLAGGVLNPTAFTATPVASDQIDLSWVKNLNDDNVMIAWNSSNTFGDPSGSYSPGDPVTGGGTVIYNGAGTAHSHSGLTDNTQYFYKAWSVDGALTYSSGSTTNATTLCNAITSFPYFEGFENGGLIPDCWSQSYENETVNWAYRAGGQSGHPAAAAGGSYNAHFYIANYNGSITKLVTPSLDLSTATFPHLIFKHAQAEWLGDQDELRVYYKTSAGGTWTLIPGAEWTGNIPDWTTEMFALPDPSADYYIAFEGTANYGYGVVIDDVRIEATPPVPLSDWAIYLGIFLIAIFMVVRFRFNQV